jgi:hypothetical protein
MMHGLYNFKLKKIQSDNTQILITVVINNYIFRLYKAAIIRPYVS